MAAQSTNTTQLKIAVVGLGKIGLPIAAAYASAGHTVVGCDLNPDVVSKINAGCSPVVDEAGLQEMVAAMVSNGRLRATLNTTAAVARSEVTVVVVPLVTNAHAKPDFRALDAATAAVSHGLRSGTLVVYETTLPVGTTRCRVAPLLESGSRLHAGRDFALAYSPERVYSGRIFEDLRRYPKIVGGIDEVSARRAAEFYRAVLGADVCIVSNVETAEFTKLAETTYRDVNFALANELAVYAGRRGASAREAFEMANTQPFSHLQAANIGIGGHCIPVYPLFMLADGRRDELELVRVARRTNDGMVRYAAQLLANQLGGLPGKRVLILGLAYRENVKELAFSVGPRLAQAFAEAGSDVLLHDPLFSPAELARLPGRVVQLNEPVDVDAVVVQAPHRAYADVDWTQFRGLRVVLDGRGKLDPQRLAGTGAVYIAMDMPLATGEAAAT